MDLTDGFGLEYPTNKLLWGSISDFKKRLMDRGWPHNFEIKIAIRSKTHRRKAALLKQNNKEEKEILPFVTQYKPLVSIIKKALMKNCNLIQNQPLPCQILKNHLTLGRTRKIIPPTLVQEEGRWNPSLEFLMCCSISKRFAFTGKPLIFLTRWGIFYERRRCWKAVTSPTMVAILADILDFTKN